MKLYVFDLDGTLADLTHRLHFILNKPKDWDSFHVKCVDDKPIKWVIELCNTIYDEKIYDYVLILSGRSDIVKTQTIQWLEENRVRYDHLLMRKHGDQRPDEIVKLEMLQEYIKYKNLQVEFIVDDRQKVVDMWRANGYNVLQCNKWEEAK